MPRTPKPLRTDISWSTPDEIFVRGMELSRDILGQVDLGGMAWLEITGRLPTRQEATVFNAMVVALVEHGLTPSTLAMRLILYGAPEALQGAVAGGLLAVGARLGGTIEDAARVLQEALPPGAEGIDLDAKAAEIVARFRESGRPIPGIGHPIHKPIDPRTPKLFAIAAENGFSGRYVDLIQAIAAEAERRYARPLPVNATGAIGAIASEMGFPWQICRGLMLMARAIGLVGHAMEELREPIAREIWERVADEATEHLRRHSEGDDDDHGTSGGRGRPR